MTNNIEKLYELAGVEKRFKAYTEDGIVKYFHTLDEIIKSKIYYRPDMYCCDLDDDAKEYPPFTDTKQLNLIKWLCVNTNRNYFKTKADYSGNNWYMECNLCVCPIQKDFSQALASLVCELWEDLTDTQREEVRGLLK